MFIPNQLQFIISICKVTFTAGLVLISINFVWSRWKFLQKRRMNFRHSLHIPCSHCIFFTDEHILKCAVHPCKALKKEAIDCLDYQPAH